MNRRTHTAAPLLIAATLLCGCSDAPSDGPPDLRVGRDECAECGMLISEDRCSSAMLVEQGGARAHVLFDDIGCMLDYERTRPGAFTPIRRFVHDHATRAWTDADDAAFLLADRDLLPTPMGTSIVAFADAQALQRTARGEITDFAGAAAARAAHAAARSSRSNP